MASDFNETPASVSDFGRGLVTYALIRKGYKVAAAERLGAHLIAERYDQKCAFFVKTRLFRPGSTENKGVLVAPNEITRLESFSKQFGMAPVFAHVYCIADEKLIHLVMMPSVMVPSVLKQVRLGYRRDIKELISDVTIDYSCWREEQIGGSEFLERTT